MSGTSDLTDRNHVTVMLLLSVRLSNRIVTAMIYPSIQLMYGTLPRCHATLPGVLRWNSSSGETSILCSSRALSLEG